MGSLKRFNLSRLKKNYDTAYLFETGTWKGDGIAYAVKFHFKKIYSSEIMSEIAQKARERFRSNKEIEIIEDSSVNALAAKINEIKGNCIFWLDAHFPGAEEGLKSYNEFDSDAAIKLPLEKELEIIAARKNKYADVILIDDLRIYEDGDYESGNMPDNILPPKIRNTRFIYNNFSDTHDIIKSDRNEGYMVLLPKGTKAPASDVFRRLTSQVLKKVY